jgi:hypothetical protein
MMSLLLLRLFLEPIINLINYTTLSLSFYLHSASLICLQLVRDVCLFRGFWSGGSGPLLDVSFGVVGFEGRSLVPFQFLEVEFLDKIRWRGMLAHCSRRQGKENEGPAHMAEIRQTRNREI